MKSFFNIILVPLVGVFSSCALFDKHQAENDNRSRKGEEFRALLGANDYDALARRYCVKPLMIKGDLDQDDELSLSDTREVSRFLKVFFEGPVPDESSPMKNITPYEMVRDVNFEKDLKRQSDGGYRFSQIEFVWDEKRGVYLMSRLYLDQSVYPIASRRQRD